MMATLSDFVRESNLIDGISRDPSGDEIAAHEAWLRVKNIDVTQLCEFQKIIAPDKPLRIKAGMDVQVGRHIAPRGGKTMRPALEGIIGLASIGTQNPWQTHVAFETLHPFMDGNGRTGRALWAWQMQKSGRDPFGLSFLHRFYYQTLENSER